MRCSSSRSWPDPPAIGLLLAALAAAPALARDVPAADGAPAAIVELPFVAQGPRLCGGAAAAMVLRYWGVAGITAEDFAGLVDESLDGIPVVALIRDLAARGFRVVPFRGESAEVESHLAQGRPVIALVESGRRQNHYVVLIGWGAGGVLLHDPAAGPWRVWSEAELRRRWSRTGLLALLVLPRDPGDAEVAPPTLSPSASCDPLVDASVRLALAGDLGGAAARLQAATALCPGSARAWRERAGVSFRAEDHAAAAHTAEHAVELNDADTATWRLLATSRFLSGETAGALDAWNRLGEPQLALVRVSGLGRLSAEKVTAPLELGEGRLLTRDEYMRAQRRLSEMPAVAMSRLSLHPIPGGRAEVDAAVLEKRRAPRFDTWLAGAALDLANERRLRIGLADVAGKGEAFDAGARLWEPRPAAWMGSSIPGVFGTPAVARVDLLWDRQTYAVGGGTDREDRSRASVSLGGWPRADVRASVGVAADHWAGSGLRASVFGSLERRLRDDSISLRADGAMWTPAGDDGAFATFGLHVAWRLPGDPASRRFEARAGLAGASGQAPLAVWPGAGTGSARPYLLRAHPLLDDGVVAGQAFGRLLVHWGVEGRPVAREVGPARVALALFADAAAGRHGVDGQTLRANLDLGAGLRAGLRGMGEMRLDAAVGVRGTFAVSVGWRAPWPD